MVIQTTQMQPESPSIAAISSPTVRFKTNLNKATSNSAVLVRADFGHNNERHTNKSTASLDEQCMLHFSSRCCFEEKVEGNSARTLSERASACSSADEGLDEEEFIEELDFGSSLSTTSSSSRSGDARQAVAAAQASTSEQTRRASLSLSSSDLSGSSPLSLSNQTSTTSRHLSIVTDLYSPSVADEASDTDNNFDVCQLTPTQVATLRKNNDDDEEEEEEDESRRQTVTYFESSLHEFQAKNNIVSTAMYGFFYLQAWLQLCLLNPCTEQKNVANN